MKNIAIFGNGIYWKDAFSIITGEELIIGVDRGAYQLLRWGVTPNIAIGDFDSLSKTELHFVKKRVKQVIACNPHPKYKTDTELALEYAVKLKPNKIVLFWSTGKRLDHTLANLFLLEKFSGKNIEITLQDEFGCVQTINKQIAIPKSKLYQYISIIPLTETAVVSLKGFLYSVDRQPMRRADSLGISNELMQDKGILTVHAGTVFLIRSHD